MYRATEPQSSTSTEYERYFNIFFFLLSFKFWDHRVNSCRFLLGNFIIFRTHTAPHKHEMHINKRPILKSLFAFRPIGNLYNSSTILFIYFFALRFVWLVRRRRLYSLGATQSTHKSTSQKTWTWVSPHRRNGHRGNCVNLVGPAGGSRPVACGTQIYTHQFAIVICDCYK